MSTKCRPARRPAKGTILRLALFTLLGAAATGWSGCEVSRQEQFHSRLERFRELLPPTVRQDFDAQRYEAAVQQIDSLVTTDPTFAARWKALKEYEAIGLFTVAEVVHYFVIYFVSYRGGS